MASNLASKSQGLSDSVNVKSKEAVVDSYQMDKIHCFCGSQKPTDSMIKDKLSYFRVKELKEVLTQLGLPKQGRKQDLADRVLASLSDERGLLAKKNDVRKDEVSKMVDDRYIKMQISGAFNLASKSQVFSDSVNVNFKEAVVDSYQMDKIRCLCGSPQPTDSMIKCEDPRCNMWQHIACVVIPGKPEEGLLPSPPEIFYYETCRLNLVDPEANDDVRFCT
ncbi:SUMO ligase siz1 [Orobanche hederae]